MNISKYKQAAEILYNSRKNKERINSLPLNLIPNNIEEGYLIQEQIIQLYLEKDDDTYVFGKKIGCTNPDAQKQLEVYEPFYGNILSNNISKSDIVLCSKNFFQPYIEPEFSFKIKENLDLSKNSYKFDEITNIIESVLPSIEIVDSRFNDWTKVGINNLIADNAVHAHYIYGKENKDINSFNFENHEVKLIINNKVIDIGNSKNVMTNPLHSFYWLIKKFKQKNKIFKKNEYISTGTCTPAIPINKGDKITADFGRLGIINFLYS